MAYTGKYRAFVRLHGNDKALQEIEWTDLRKTQAKWRYHWIKRKFYAGEFKAVKEYGWEREWVL